MSSVYVKRTSENIAREVHALQVLAGPGCVTLLGYDVDSGSLMLSRIEPGTTLAQLDDDDAAMRIAAAVIRALQRDVPNETIAPTIFAELDRVAQTALILDAVSIANELRSSSPLQFLHGDLHQENILADGDDWIAIDPKGLIAPRECEIAPLLLNRGDIARLVQRRMELLCDALAFDPRRAYAWAFVRAALSVEWAIEDDGTAPDGWLDVVESLRP